MKKQEQGTAQSRQAFSVTAEIKRNRRMRRSAGIRRARNLQQAAVTVIVCFGVVVFLALILCFAVFRVQTVTVQGNERYTTEELTAALDLRPTDSVLWLSERTLLARILKVCPYVTEVKLEKHYPSAVTLTVMETRAVYATEMRGVQILMDADFRVIGQGAPDGSQICLDLPEIHSAVEGEILRFTDEENSKYVFSVAQDILSSELAISSADLQNRFSLSVCVGDTAQILLGDTAQLPLKLQVAAKVLETARKEGSLRTKIDASDPKRVSASYDWAVPFDK